MFGHVATCASKRSTLPSILPDPVPHSPLFRVVQKARGSGGFLDILAASHGEVTNTLLWIGRGQVRAGCAKTVRAHLQRVRPLVERVRHLHERHHHVRWDVAVLHGRVILEGRGGEGRGVPRGRHTHATSRTAGVREAQQSWARNAYSSTPSDGCDVTYFFALL